MAEGFEDFYNRFLTRSVAYLCRRYFRDTNDAEDLAQEVLLAAYENGLHLQDRDPWPWLMRILNNKAIDLLRQRSRRQQHLIPNPDEIPREAPEPAVAREQAASIIEFFADSGLRLTGQRQEVLEAGAESIIEEGEFSSLFVSHRLGINEGALRTAMSRFRGWLSDESRLSFYLLELENNCDLLPPDDDSLASLKIPSMNGSSVWSITTGTFWGRLLQQHKNIAQNSDEQCWLVNYFHDCMTYVAEVCARNRNISCLRLREELEELFAETHR